MRRKAVTQRLKKIAGLRAMIRVSGESLSRRLARRPTAPREGFSYGPVFEQWVGELAAVERGLATAEDAYVQDKLRLVGLRQDRNEAGSGLYREQMRLQAMLRLLVDPNVLGAAGIAGSVPQGGDALVRWAEWTVRLVRDLGNSGRCPLARLGVDAGTAAERLEERRRKLVAARRGLEQGRQAVVASRCRADEEVAAVDKVMPTIARGLESLLRVVGEPGLADRVRAR